MRLKCNHIKNLLSDYLDGILPENQTFAISQHLKRCRVCQRELETLRKTNQLLKFYIEKSPPDGYFQQFWPNLEYQIEHRNSYSHLSLQWLVTLLMLKLKGFKASFLVRCEEIKTTYRDLRHSLLAQRSNLNSQWYKILVNCAVVVCFVLMGIFIDRTYIRSSDKVVSEFIKNSLFSSGTYYSEFSNQRKRNDNRMPVGYQVKAINLIKEENRENIFNALPVLHGKVGSIDIDLHPVSFKNGVLTLVANLADVDDIPTEQLLMANQQSHFNTMGYFGEVEQLPRSLDLPEVPKVSSNKMPKFERWLANLLADVTLPTLSIADASELDNVATGRISD